jgi:GR25 family glycosyltransferase involved in LPS biosynthesis
MEKNWPFALILEDDIHLPHILTETSAKAVKHDLKDEGWDVCYFGYTDPKGPFRPWGTGNAHQAFYEVFGCNCGHAYLLNRKAMATILKLLPIEHDIWPWLARHRAVDRFYYRNLAPSLKVIALSSSLIEQKPGQSDILNRPTEQQALHYRVKIDSDQASPRLNYRCLLYARKWAFKLQGVLDCVRGWWKKKRGF